MTTAALALLCSCGKEPDDPIVTPPDPVVDPDPYGLAYVYDSSVLPEIHVSITEYEFQTLLKEYDKDSDTKKQIHCDIVYDKGGEQTVINDASIRLKGNTSRRRPMTDDGRWHHCHWQVNFRKFVKDDEHTLHGARKIVLKWCKDDPTYVHEMYSYDMFRRMGVWTGANDVYARLFMKAGKGKEAYLGVYNMIEPIDEQYLKARADRFGSAKGYLWKCSYGADLRDKGKSMGPDLDDGNDYIYELKTQTDDFAKAKAQLLDFMTKLNTLSGKEFQNWIMAHCDTELLMRTYAVNVAVGMWDDYWNNTNNFYIYFSGSGDSYKFYFIPYDYDNTLGTSADCGVQTNSGTHNPFEWGNSGTSPLIYKVLQISECRKAYSDALLEMAEPSNALLYYISSRIRIQNWHAQIADYVANDTGEDNTIADRPASWGNHGEYRIFTTSDNNFFRAKCESIARYCK